MKIPCIICLKQVETKDKRIIATVCKDCLTTINIKKIGKYFDNKSLRAVLKKAKDQTHINKYGEVI